MWRAWLSGLAVCGLLLAAESVRASCPGQHQKILKQVMPVYPPDAKAKGIHGTVRMQVTLDRQGAVRHIIVLGGPEELVQPSIDAVKQWVYQPTLREGEAVEVMADIALDYKLER